MADVPGAEADLAAIHAEFAIEVTYTGAGLAAGPISAVASEIAADSFQGPGDSLREFTFEVLFAALPGSPAKGDSIVESDGTSWRVNDVTRRGDIAAWVLGVESAQ